VGLKWAKTAFEPFFPGLFLKPCEIPARLPGCILGQVADAVQTLASVIKLVGSEPALDAAICVPVILQTRGTWRHRCELGQHLGTEGMDSSRNGRTGPPQPGAPRPSAE
jgi:hypothetical protein